MNLTETDQLLTIIHNIDKRIIDDATVLVWHEILGDLQFADCVQSVTAHFRESTDYLLPAHIVRGARELERERIRDHNHQRALDAAPELDSRPLTDRKREIRDFVNGVRSVLPPGDPDTLRHGKGYWRQVREARERQETAEPNPHYDPAAAARAAEVFEP